MSDADPTVTVVDKDGANAIDIPTSKLGAYAGQGFHVETGAARADRIATAAQDASVNPINTVNAGLLRGATLGASDAIGAAVGGEDTRRALARDVSAHPTLAAGANVVGAVVDPFDAIGGIAGGAGHAVEGAIAGEGASSLAQIGARAAGGATEGAIIGAGQGVSDLALSDDPLTMEHVASSLSSNALFGGVTGGVLGGAGKLLEKGLVRAKGALDTGLAAGAVPDDLAALDAKGLRDARGAEVDAIEAGRVPQRASLADDIASFRADTKGQKLWLSTAGGATDAAGEKIEGIGAIGKRTLGADRELDRLTDNPYALAEKPELALQALQKQQAALEKLLAKEPQIRGGIQAETAKAQQAARQAAADEALAKAGPRPPGAPPLEVPQLATADVAAKGARETALDNVPAALERNKALQARIRELQAEPMSERLKVIDNAKDALEKTGGKSLSETMLGGAVQGAVTHAVGAVVPGVGHVLGAMAGAKAAGIVSDVVFGRAAKAAAEAAARTSQAVDAFMTVGKKIAPAAPVLATKVLSRVAFGPTPHPSQGERVEPHPPLDEDHPPPKADLAKLYTARSAELRSQVAIGPDGTPQMQPAARAAMAARLAPMRAGHPLMADQVETIAARRVEYLASMLPKRPDLGGLPTGPDRWHPSDMEMREFARRVAAVEDPGGVEERVAHGSVTPEDAEAYRAVYPERAAAFQQAIVERLPELRKQLPYQRRMALSIFTGIPVDPAMSPNIFAVLQGQFTGAPDGGDGMSAPKAQPQFGSVRKSIEQPTPGQHRSQG